MRLLSFFFILEVAALLLVASLAEATLTECGPCCTQTCTTETVTTITSEAIEHREWVAGGPVLSPAVLHTATTEKKQQHCTDAGSYDQLFSAVTAGDGGGYTLDADGSTLWSADRSYRVYRCKPAVFTAGLSLAASASDLPAGYWQKWIEWIEHSTSWSKTVCRLDFNPSEPSSPAPVPEPSTLLLLGVGVIGCAGMYRSSKKRS